MMQNYATIDWLELTVFQLADNEDDFKLRIETKLCFNFTVYSSHVKRWRFEKIFISWTIDLMLKIDDKSLGFFGFAEHQIVDFWNEMLDEDKAELTLTFS